jgi:hypothetical protein
MRIPRSPVVLAALLAAFPSPAYEPLGELDFSAAGQAGGASFDREQVVGSEVTISLQRSGGWAGELGHRGTRLTATPTHLGGAGLSLAVSQRDGALTMEGLVFGRRVRLALDQKALTGRYGACAFELTRAGPGLYLGDVGCQRTRGGSTTSKATLRLTGQAAGPEAPSPQLPLALLAVLPS